MKKYFTKLALVIGCVGSMCFLGGNTLASTKEIVSDMETFNRAREAVAEEYKEILDDIRATSEDKYREIKMILVKGDLIDITKDMCSEHDAMGIEDILRGLNQLAETLNAEEKYGAWKAFWKGVARGKIDYHYNIS